MKSGRISGCRACRSVELVTVVDLGSQALTGVFPAQPAEDIRVGPLQLMWCSECTLLQLSQSFPPEEMYGDNYGYRSGLNASMVSHLASTVARIESMGVIDSGGTVLDIGSNDGTLLAQYSDRSLRRIGIDPTVTKFTQYYAQDIVQVPDFFSQAAFESVSDDKADVITSLSMFYDLEDPVTFAQEVSSCLSENGVWVLEQSYMPSMLRTTSYDTICHEHLEYYSLKNIVDILEPAGLAVLDVSFNSVNGGSFAVSASHAGSQRERNTDLLTWFQDQEERMGFTSPRPFRSFEERIYRHRTDLRSLVSSLRQGGKRIFGLGASTKGNVLLQFCGLGPDDIEMIADVNPYKHGRFTPGTGIPIVSEDVARDLEPDFFLVLPWHFREGIIQREQQFLARGGGLIFPLPEIEIVRA